MQNTSTSRRLNCNHSYHLDCILKWYKSSSQCPICRKDQSEDIFIEFKEDIKREMRELYSDAIRTLEEEVEEYRQSF